MAGQLHRKKQPEQVRDNLLAAACELTIEYGWGNFSLDAVAEKAGVSKGGLTYHFANKQVLLDALSDDLIERMESYISQKMDEDPEPKGRFIRAYLSFPLMDDEAPLKKLILAASLSSPQDERACEKWKNWVDARLQGNFPYAGDMLVKFAADGLWLDTMYGMRISKAMQHEIADRLIKMTMIREEPFIEPDTTTKTFLI